MTAQEKTDIYQFLATAEGYVSGYRIDRAAPAFADDAIASAEPSTSLSGAGGASPTPEGRACPYDSLEALADAVRSCTRCPLAEGRTLAVPGEGSALTRQVLVVGEGPGADEDASGRPFVGKAGQLLDKMLASIGLSRGENCFIANIVKCRPPQNREPGPDETAACREYLEAQIALLRPLMILVLGRTAAQNLLGTTEGIHKLRGRVFERNGIPLVPTYHPSALLRDESLKRPAWEDLKLFRAELERRRGL